MSGVSKLTSGSNCCKNNQGSGILKRLEYTITADESIIAGLVIAAGGADGSVRGKNYRMFWEQPNYQRVYGTLSQVNQVDSVWDAATGESGGPVKGKAYCLSQTSTGHLTGLQPTSGQIVYVGIALDSKTLSLQFSNIRSRRAMGTGALGPTGAVGPTEQVGPTGPTGSSGPE